MPSADPSADALTGGARLLERAFRKQAAREVWPTPAAEVAPSGEPLEALNPGDVRPIASVHFLKSSKDWDDFHEEFVGDRLGNLLPWFRCIGVLRGLGAVCVLVEPYYMCLDHKSEHVTFYAHIDEIRDPSTVRLHFFDKNLESADLSALTGQEKDSYLGYIVCRRGSLPLVGRALLRPPASYIAECAEIEEPVHLFGQTLRAHGVPFMQQDQRFAVCAHVAVWIVEYTAYRRGLTDRRVIAHVAESAGATRALLPRNSQGLTPSAVARALDDIGFRVVQFATPTADVTSSSLPPLSNDGLPDQLKTTLEDLFGDLVIRPNIMVEAAIAEGVQRREATALAELLSPHFQGAADTATSAGDEGALADKGFAALDAIHDHLLSPYVRSRLPVYLATKDHAMVLCGRSTDPSGSVYFFHDDQIGPYLATRHLYEISRQDLEVQAGWRSRTDPTKFATTPPSDVVPEYLKHGVESAKPETADRSVEMILLPVPARAMLLPWEAIADALTHLGPLDEQVTGGHPYAIRASVLMGIDYKSGRREQAIELSDDSGRQFFSAINVAEWVVVVEAVDPNDETKVLWELVYDASSSGAAPRLQVGRYQGAVLAEQTPAGELQGSVLEQSVYPPLTVPMRIGKTAI